LPVLMMAWELPALELEVPLLVLRVLLLLEELSLVPQVLLSMQMGSVQEALSLMRLTAVL
jgi:hypothetical protein